MKLCKNDPVLDILRDAFDANPIRVPEARIQPLRVLISQGGRGKYFYQGELKNVMAESATDVLAGIRVEEDQVANFKSRSTNSINAEVGIKVLDGYLSGFQLTVPQLNAAFRGAREVSFTFADVVRRHVDPAGLGKAVAKTRVTESTKRLIDEGYELFVIDGVLLSREFSISVTEADSQDFSIKLEILADAIGKGQSHVSITNSTQRDITFCGDDFLAFAFSIRRLKLTPAGVITVILPHTRQAELGITGDANEPDVPLREDEDLYLCDVRQLD